MKSIPSKIRRTVVWLVSLNLLWQLGAFAANTDNFDSDSKNTDKWGTDVVVGNGAFSDTGPLLNYVCASPGIPEDDDGRPWILSRFPVNADWEMQIDLANSSTPNQSFQVDSAGITLYNPHDADSEIYLELYAAPFGSPVNKGFDAHVLTGNVDNGSDSGQVAGNETVNGAVRMVYASATKVVTCYYDADTTDGYQWTELASFGLAGSGGTTGNTDWGLTDNEQFSSDVYGFSQGMVVTSGQITLDNFSETGGVTPSGPPSPIPHGSYQFGFPTGNPSLIAIANITGNYTGIDPYGSSRAYDLDVAQDESGKVTAMGAVDGVANATGGGELSGSVGAVTTVDNKPTLEVKTSFTGTGDGIPVSGKLAATAPVELTDIGGGSNGVAVTTTISAKVAGVPVSYKSVPAFIPSTPSMESNFKTSWNFNLDLSQKTVKGKEVTVATLQLMLPSGDIIEYPERVVKYSTTKGFKLSFKGGTNTSQNPATVDKKSKITITGLLFEKQGDDWVPTAGSVLYQFHGQKGGADLLDFDMP